MILRISFHGIDGKDLYFSSGSLYFLAAFKILLISSWLSSSANERAVYPRLVIVLKLAPLDKQPNKFLVVLLFMFCIVWHKPELKEVNNTNEVRKQYFLEQLPMILVKKP